MFNLEASSPATPRPPSCGACRLTVPDGVGRRPARRQRRRQDHAAAGGLRAAPADLGTDDPRRRRRHQRTAPTSSPPAASATCPKGAASSRPSRCGRTSPLPGRPRRQGQPRPGRRRLPPPRASGSRQTAGTMSGGEQQMLALARAYIADPKVVLLDEVSMGLAPKIVDEIFEFLGRVAHEGASPAARRAVRHPGARPGRLRLPPEPGPGRLPRRTLRTRRTRTSSPATSAPKSAPGTRSLPSHTHPAPPQHNGGFAECRSHPHHRRPGRRRPRLRRHRLVSGRRRRVHAHRGFHTLRRLHVVRRPGHGRGLPVHLRGAGVRGRRHLHRRRRPGRASRSSTGSATRSRSPRCPTRPTTPSAGPASSPA